MRRLLTTKCVSSELLFYSTSMDKKLEEVL